MCRTALRHPRSTRRRSNPAPTRMASSANCRNSSFSWRRRCTYCSTAAKSTGVWPMPIDCLSSSTALTRPWSDSLTAAPPSLLALTADTVRSTGSPMLWPHFRVCPAGSRACETGPGEAQAGEGAARSVLSSCQQTPASPGDPQAITRYLGRAPGGRAGSASGSPREAGPVARLRATEAPGCNCTDQQRTYGLTEENARLQSLAPATLSQPPLQAGAFPW